MCLAELWLTNPVVGFAAFMATAGAFSTVRFFQLYFLLVAACLIVPGVLTHGRYNVTSPLGMQAVCRG